MQTFSIITPTLGRSRFLEEALESVSMQTEGIGTTTFQAEHLLIASPWLDSIATNTNPTLKTQLIQSPASGAAEAYNIGLSKASGDIIGCLADDDIFLPSTFQRVAKVFADHPTIDLLIGGVEQIDEDSVTYKRRIPRKITASRIRRKSDYFLPSLFFRRDLLDSVGILEPSLQYHYWFDFVIRCYMSGKQFHQVSEYFSGKRRHRGNRRFGISSIAERAAISQERVELLHRRLGYVPANSILDLAHYQAVQQGFAPVKSGYDSAILRYANEIHGRFSTTSEGKSSFQSQLAKIRLYSTYFREQASHAVKYPRAMTRFLPKSIGQPIRGFFRSRLFQLHQHDPRTPRLKSNKIAANSSDRLSIGIVTPNYNTAEFLQRTIESVVHQDFPPLQYAVQDGNSDDGSVQIIKRFSDQLHYWKSEPDSGQTQAINRGLKQLDTDIMAYLNSDDVLLPGSLSFVSEYFRRNPDVDVIYGHRLIIDENDQEIGRWILPKHDDRAIMFADYIPQETMFWRKRAWDAVGNELDESFQFAMDWDLILRFRSAGLKFVRVPRFLGAFRVIETQKTQVLLETLGATEMNRLRRRELGHIPTTREMRRAIRPYRFRQWVQHHAHTLIESTLS